MSDESVCAHCGETFEDNGSVNCDDCNEDVCVNCGEINNPTLFEGDSYCEDCFSETFTYCDVCGEVTYQDDCIILDDKVLCESCAGCYKCEHCGDYTKDGYIGDNDYYCQDCFDTLYTYCDDCGESISREVATCIDYDEYCEECRDENFFHCESCYAWHSHDDYGRNGLCIDCDDTCSNPGRPIVGTSTNRTGSKRCFGIEIEADDGDFDCRPGSWGCVEDGSISGLELVSPIMSGDAGIESIEACYRDVRPSFDDSCGIHVHVDVRDLTDDERFEVLKAFQASKNEWFSRVDPDRWENAYCAEDMPDEWDDYARFINAIGYKRYFWCNPASISKHGTIEIRLLEGTEEVDVVTKWVIDLIRFVDNVVKKVMV